MIGVGTLNPKRGLVAWVDVASVSFDGQQVGKSKAGKVLRRFPCSDDAPAEAAPAPASVADELAKLADLRTSGVLSDDEFAAAKARLLG